MTNSSSTCFCIPCTQRDSLEKCVYLVSATWSGKLEYYLSFSFSCGDLRFSEFNSRGDFWVSAKATKGHWEVLNTRPAELTSHYCCNFRSLLGLQSWLRV